MKSLSITLRAARQSYTRSFARSVALFGALLAVASPVRQAVAAPKFTSLHKFSVPTPTRPIQASDGNFYGALYGGLPTGFGSIYKLGPDGTETVIYQFSGGADGANPSAALVQGSDGNFYGTTANGGANGLGTIFKITGAGGLTTLHTFAGGEGKRPAAELIQRSDGDFYGVARYGGANGNGTIFKITSTGAFTTLHSFAAFDPGVGVHSNAEGAQPGAALAFGNDGNLYGTTLRGGSNEYGTIFQITPSGTFQTLHTFDGTDGNLALAPLYLAADGNLYGTTSEGGRYQLGNLFQLAPTGAVTSIYEFDLVSNPMGPIFQGNDGTFYGAASTDFYGGNGSIYKITPAGQRSSVYYIKNGAIGQTPATGIIRGADGNIYGVTSAGGAGAGAGVFFKVVPATDATSATSQGTASVIHSFTEEGELAEHTTVTVAADGTLFGTAGNFNTAGSIFHMTALGALASVHKFDLDTEPTPLLLGSDGNFYGATGHDGDYGDGTIYQLTPDGTFTVLHVFDDQYGHSEGRNPEGALVEGPDGLLWGTCSHGGLENSGTFFRCSKAGDRFEVNWEFGSGNEGGGPTGPLTFGDDGLAYGTALLGGSRFGTVFRGSGSFGNLYTFTNGPDGAYPQGGLVKGPDGNFYGTTATTVFKITPLGALTTLYTFTGGSDGTTPGAPLTVATDGNLYGTTLYGGIEKVVDSSMPDGFGTIFKITPAGVLTTLHTFTGGSDGGGGTAPMVQGPDGVLYGAANGPVNGGYHEAGGQTGGVIFRLELNPPPFFDGEVALSNDVYYLAFPNNGNTFGYYKYLTDPHYIYHFDLGFEYVFDAADGKSGVWFYDFTSSDFFYTSPNLAFPYLYDNDLQAFLYYYPDPTNPQRYNTNGVRYFYNFSTGQIISK